MRPLSIAFAILGLSAAVARAEDMVGINPEGIMCRDEKALADFTAPGGGVKPQVIANPSSPTFRRYMSVCQNIAEQPFTSSPNAPTPRASPTTAKPGTGFQRTDEVDPNKGFHYPRLTLDKPVCYLGNLSESDGRYVSLVGTSAAAFQALMHMVGKHVAVTDEIGSPDNGNQPPDPMMIFDPAVRPAP